MHEACPSLIRNPIFPMNTAGFKTIEKTDTDKTSILLATFIAGILLCNGYGLITQTILTAALEALIILTIRKQFEGTSYPLQLPSKPVFIAIALLALLSLIQAITEIDNKSLSLVQGLRFISVTMHFIFFIHLGNYLLRHRSFTSIAFQTIATTGSLIAIANFYEANINQPSSDLFEPVFSKNIRHLGFIASAGFIISCCSLIYSITPLKKLLLCSTNLILNLSLLIWLGGRTSIVIAAIVLVLIILHSYFSKSTTFRNIKLLLIIITAALIFESNLETYPWNGINRVFGTFDASIESLQDVEKLSSGRLSMWSVAWDEIKEQPLLGYGPDGYLIKNAAEESALYAHPHNLILQLLYNYGLATSILILALLASSTFNCIKHIYHLNIKSDYHIASIMIILALSANSMTSGAYYFPHSLTVVAICFACYFSISKDS